MNEKTKNYLGIAVIISVLLVAYSAWSAANSYSRSIEPSSFRSFNVSGEGEVVAVPDVAQFSFSVLTQGGRNLADLQTENTKKVNEAIAFVKSKNIEAKDIKTQNYNIEPRYQYYSCPVQGGSVEPCPPPDIVGYTLTQTVLVKIRDFAKIGEVLSGVVQNGANSISQLNFTIDDPTVLQNEARAMAISKAKAQAQAVAKAAGFGLGRLLSISESGFPPPIPYYLKAAERGGFGGDVQAVPAIEPGSQEVKVTVTLTYEIK